MNIISFLFQLVGSLGFLLYGMKMMSDGIQKSAGEGLQRILGLMTGNRILAVLTGLFITMIIQSSSATTVMVVSFVNAGLLTLKQSVGVIFGANIGTTVTAWILSLGGISSDNLVMQLLKPTSFTPVLALIGIVYYMFIKDSSKKDIGLILLGWGIVQVGLSLQSHDPSQRSNGFLTLAGGIIITFTKEILTLITG